MLIRSQDRKSLINMDQVSTITALSYGEVYFYTEENSGMLGEYCDTNRAIEVLDEIEKAYIGCRPCGGQIEVNIVFQMPDK